MRRLGGMAALALALAGRPAAAQGSALPPAVREVDLEEHLGQRVDRSLAFTDMDGRPVRLGDYLPGDKPLLLVLAYDRCPMLCGLVLRGVVAGLRGLDWKPGERYRVLDVSFDPRDRPEAARQKRASTLAALGLPERSPEWPFLVGDERATRALAGDLGFRYAYDARTDQYAHPAAIFALTPDGRISRYLYGIDFSPRDLRLALLEAGEGRTGTLVDRVLLTCYRYDPASRKYGPAIAGFMRLGAVAILLAVAGVLGALWRGERRRRARDHRAGGGRDG